MSLLSLLIKLMHPCRFENFAFVFQAWRFFSSRLKKTHMHIIMGNKSISNQLLSRNNLLLYSNLPHCFFDCMCRSGQCWLGCLDKLSVQRSGDRRHSPLTRQADHLRTHTLHPPSQELCLSDFWYNGAAILITIWWERYWWYIPLHPPPVSLLTAKTLLRGGDLKSAAVLDRWLRLVYLLMCSIKCCWFNLMCSHVCWTQSSDLSGLSCNSFQYGANEYL